ncbi:SigB/SigF/SigG family RNA polymerase sigma factor [Mycolicibacterium bacteremicum]|uniref:SigB/SigF/SigG family RNA polymerase sigma factor n=1 Tax=Mycolicibacterium bacteremicum TaxID=564198 RepID=UPI0026F1BD44|nr:SigB/SigF/SigG family RNA polymerase sigma factor [Mycolicibacterium bacteremicum]
MPRTDHQYAEIAEMIRVLRTHEPDSRAHRRLYEDIIARIMPLAEHVAQRYSGRGQPYDDLHQVACIGLIKAVNRFDPDRGADFLSFAVPTVMGEVRRHFRDTGWAVNVPRRLKDLSLQLTKAREELTRTLGHAPTATEIATHLGIERDEVVQATVAASHYSTVSTDRPTGDDGDDFSLSDTLGGVDTRLDKVVDVETVRPLIAKLTARERTVLNLRFFDDMTQTQIAEQMGCSQMQVSRILAKALDSLRKQAESQMIERPRSSAAA